MTTSRGLKSLKARCLKQNIDPELKVRYRTSWAVYYALYVTHFFSIRLVWLLVRTPVKPNQVSLAAIAVGLAAAACFQAQGWWLLGGALLFEFFYVLDAVDGQLARAKSMSSKGGAFLDEWGNFVVTPVVIFAIGLGHATQPWAIFLAAFATIMIPSIEYIAARISGGQPKMNQARRTTQSQRSLGRAVYTCMYRSCTMPVVMNLVTVCTLLTLAGGTILGHAPYALLIQYFAVVGTAVWFVRGLHTGFYKLEKSAT